VIYDKRVTGYRYHRLGGKLAGHRVRQGRAATATPLHQGCSRYPTAAEAAAHPYTPWEAQIVQEARRRRVAGTPEQCRERLEALAQEYGVDEIVVVTITETAATRLRSYELLAQAFELGTR